MAVVGFALVTVTGHLGGIIVLRNGAGVDPAILELGHEVDFFYMTPQMRREVIQLWHP